MRPLKPVMISIIGAGNMGGAMLKAMLKAGISSPSLITVSDPGKDKLGALEHLGVRTTENNLETLDSEVLLLAVKPQQFTDLSRPLRGKIAPKTVVISIMAGTSVATIRESLRHKKIVRAMPNTPALIGKGVIGWFSAPAVNSEEKAGAEKILKACGETFEFRDESLLNDVTALSGCGPGFFFALIKAWQEGLASTLHLPKDQSEMMLFKTLEGSIALLAETGKSPETLMNEVASKGGSTEAGLKELQKRDLGELFAAMIKAAYNRCNELSQQA